MALIDIKHKGSFKNAKRFFEHATRTDYRSALRKYGEAGVAALAAATPKDSGKTAESWSYSISKEGSSYIIYWKNNHTNDGYNIAILLQYGHGTGSGAYVEGVDYINPALQQVFGELANEAFKLVTPN